MEAFSHNKILAGIIILGIIGLIALFKFIYRKTVSSTIRWYDEASFDSSPRNFGLTAAAVYDNGIRIDVHKDFSEPAIERGKEILQSAWTTTNKQELLETIENLRTDIHRSGQNRMATHVNSLNKKEFTSYLKEIDDNDDRNQAKLLYGTNKYTPRAFMAWDLLRYFFIAHSGVVAQYITIEEFEEYCNPVIRTLQQHYKSWDDFFNQFLLGRNVWKGEESSVSITSFQNRVKDLLENESSPCRKVDWNCPVTVLPEQEMVIMDDHTFWELIATTNNTGLTTFLPRLEGAISQLEDNAVFSFKAKMDTIIETFANPVFRYGGSLMVPENTTPYLLLVWLVYRGEQHYKQFIQTPDEMLTKELALFMGEYQKEKAFFSILEENMRLFSVADSIITNRKLNPLFKTLTYEEQIAIYDASYLAMPIPEEPYVNLVRELSKWS